MHYSVLIPIGDHPTNLGPLLAEVSQTLARLDRPFELICVSGATLVDTPSLAALRRQYSRLRLAPVQPGGGLSAALTAGIAAAQGEIVIAVEASQQYLPEQIGWLLAKLTRADLVFGRRMRGRLSKSGLAVSQLPRRLLLGLEVRDPDCLFWAARHEAVAGLHLAPGMHRFLASLVSTRGYRVTEIHVDHRPGQRFVVGNDSWPNPRNLVTAWWQRRLAAAERAAQQQNARQPEVASTNDSSFAPTLPLDHRKAA